MQKNPKLSEEKNKTIEIMEDTENTHLSSEEDLCPNYFGYLNTRSKKEEIPEKCIVCKKVIECLT